MGCAECGWGAVRVGFVNGGVPGRDIVAEARVTVGFVDDVVGEGGLTNRFVGGVVCGALRDAS